VASDDASNTAWVGAHYPQWPTRPDAPRVRVLIGGVFVGVVTDLKTYVSPDYK
jgi:hypothetical protein